MLWLFSRINNLLHILRPSLSLLLQVVWLWIHYPLMKQPELWERSVECCLPVRGRADTLAGMWGGTIEPRLCLGCSWMGNQPSEAEPEEFLQEVLD